MNPMTAMVEADIVRALSLTVVAVARVVASAGVNRCSFIGCGRTSAFCASGNGTACSTGRAAAAT